MGYGPDLLVDRQLKTLGPGGGLYLQVAKPRAKTPSENERFARSWIFLFWDGRRYRKMGLGSLTTVSLAQARERAAEARPQRENGKDPIWGFDHD